MTFQERRKHFRVDDKVYFNYRIFAPGEPCPDLAVINQLLGDQGKKLMDSAQFLHSIDSQLAETVQEVAKVSAHIAHYLNLLNSKVDYLSRQLVTTGDLEFHQVTISLGGMAFRTPELVNENSSIKIVLITHPKMIPIIIDGLIIYSQFQSTGNYKTAVQFSPLTAEQEQLLSEHILLAQVKNRSD